MSQRLILASGSAIRAHMLTSVRVPFDVVKPRVDEDSVKAAMLAEAAPARDIADKLAELKALKVSDRAPDALVLGCDQVLEFQGEVLSKSRNKGEAIACLRRLQGRKHRLFSAAVIAEAGRPLWRQVNHVVLTMRSLSDGFIDGYVTRNWDQVADAVGAYKLEQEGARLFTRVQGDYFTVLGMPLLEVLEYLAVRGGIET